MKATRSWIRIARCHDIPLREGRSMKVGDREIAIFNLGDRFLAVDNRCPHKAGPLADGIVVGATVVCPLHAWKISLETGEGVNSASGSNCIQTFRTRVDNGIILVELNASPREGQEGGRQELTTICPDDNASPASDCLSTSNACLEPAMGQNASA